MTKLMTEALKMISKLPVEQQDALAAVLLEELEDDKRWSETFKRSQPALERLAGEALEELKAGRTRDLDFHSD